MTPGNRMSTAMKKAVKKMKNEMTDVMNPVNDLYLSPHSMLSWVNARRMSTVTTTLISTSRGRDPFKGNGLFRIIAHHSPASVSVL
jgi:hypothetical protein